MDTIEVSCPTCSDVFQVTSKDETKSRHGKTFSGGCIECLTWTTIRFPTKEEIAYFERDVIDKLKLEDKENVAI
jgi:hypothetical protein